MYGKCKSILLDFPEVKAIQATAATFDKLVLGRKEHSYATAVEIARLIILNFAPNVKSGSEKMIALLFDMNNLWEEYILVQLKKAFRDDEVQVLGQRSKTLWNNFTIRPDIVIKRGEETLMIIDTKWKIIDHNKPSTNDLRQMYVYNEYWKALIALLVYPGTDKAKVDSEPIAFDKIPGKDHNHKCGLAWINVLVGDKLNSKLGHDLKQILISNKLIDNSF
mgnify:CR=1 FL=1